MIARATVDIAAGKLDQKIIRSSNDEIGDLSSAFNKMSHDLVKIITTRKKKLLSAQTTDI